MIIFDRFLCCINLKTFGKFFGWSGTMISILTSYAAFLVASGRRTAGSKATHHMIYGENISIEDFYRYTGMLIALLLTVALFHILLICGVKYRKSILIIPYVVLTVVLTAAVICILPSEIHLTESNEHKATSPYIIAACIFVLIFSVYFSLCIYSLYAIIKCEEKRRKLYRNPDTIFIAPIQLKI